ncbi:MAG: ABC transporter substrate-binding protein [Sandaracinaceae bacterium]|jgi:phospholipid transport system substrate-binding protein|nr:ABC transporter substrate-binding protein [Sandaracinaceae bacterium]MBK6811730.1 ABC transporter substrate-binding protein [Sandaracinaceae bacterium]MBK7155725.1 ABC transporter substrate-binding protein [Sandaracinaceae bacterium]MBK7775376.1 ABC transporter substrate-binding protein [Sandaracinaceae bacterium]MBK8408159.1 ABC transporter substrate-binding protein [Sandaracinaceae bacterium]
MMQRRRFLLLAALSTLLLAGVVPAAADAQANPAEAQAFLTERHEALRTLFAQRASATRNQRLSTLVSELLDLEELSRQALRDHWDTRTPAQREEFVSLLRQLVQEQYERNLERTMNYTVTYDGADVRGQVVTVRTLASSASNRRAPAVSIDYQMVKVGNTWRVFDISTDGVSLVRNYRTQFNRIIEREGWDALIARMRERL